MFCAVLTAVPSSASAHSKDGHGHHNERTHRHYWFKSVAVLGYEGYDAEITIQLSNAPSADLEFTISYSDVDGDGDGNDDASIVDADYTNAKPTTLTVPGGEKQATLTIPIAADSIFETDERAKLTFTPPTGSNYEPLPTPQVHARFAAYAARDGVVLTIPANNYFWVDSIAVNEGDKDPRLTDPGSFRVEIWLSTPVPSGRARFTYSTRYSGASTADVNFPNTAVTLTAIRERRTAGLTFQIVDDSDPEPKEQFYIDFNSPPGWRPLFPGANTATVTIWANDGHGDQGTIDHPESPIQPESPGGGESTERSDGVVRRGEVSALAEQVSGLVVKVRQWRDDPCCKNNKDHTDRWDRVLLALGETVADNTLVAMTATEAQGLADRGWTRWQDVADILAQLEAASEHTALITKMYEWRNDPCCAHNKAHTDRWDRALLAFGETIADNTLTAMTAAQAQALADRGWTRWQQVATALAALENG